MYVMIGTHGHQLPLSREEAEETIQAAITTKIVTNGSQTQVFLTSRYTGLDYSVVVPSAVFDFRVMEELIHKE